MDRNIQDGLINLEAAEKIVGHHWVGIDKDKWANPAKKVDYNFAPELDGDIIDAQKNQVLAEKQLGKEYELDWIWWEGFLIRISKLMWIGINES